MIRNDTHTNIKRYLPIFLTMFGLIFVRFCYFGFQYYYQLDDYIQYHNYAAYNKDLWALIAKLGMLSARPLAGLSDLFVWTHFYRIMIVLVGLISALYSISAILLHRVFSKHFGTGYLFFVVLTLMPLGFEGTYWVSASTRIVIGLFFASVSLCFFDKWCEIGKTRDVVMFSVTQFVAFCLYEQVTLFSLAATFIIMLCYFRKKETKRALFGLLMLANLALYFGITNLAQAGLYSQRTVYFLPWDKDYVKLTLNPLLEQLQVAFLNGSSGTLGKGLVRGFKLMLTQPNALFVIVGIITVSSLFSIVKSTKRRYFYFFSELSSGLILAIAPMAVFLLIKQPWFSLRNTVMSYCGLALILDALMDLICGRFKKGYLAEALIVSALAVIFSVASISEMNDYREVTKADTSIAAETAEALKSSEFNSKSTIWLLNVYGTYVDDGNLYFHEHDYGVTSSPWAMTGAVGAISGRRDIAENLTIVPLSYSGHIDIDKRYVGVIPVYWYYGESVIPTVITQTGYDSWLVSTQSGQKLAALENRYGYIYLVKKSFY